MNASRYLIIAPYPIIMPRHAGKILCGLLAFLHFFNLSSIASTSDEQTSCLYEDLWSKLKHDSVDTDELVTSIAIATFILWASSILENYGKVNISKK